MRRRRSAFSGALALAPVWLLVAAACGPRQGAHARPTRPPAATSASATAPASTPSASIDATAPDASAAPPPVAALPRELGPARPCEIVVERAPGLDRDECIEIERIQPEALPVTICAMRTTRLEYRYDDAGRIVEAPGARYVHGKAGKATRTRDGRATPLRFDAASRLVQDGATRRRYDAAGRIVREESGGHFLAYDYAADGTYTTRHDYPDRDEFCVADRVAVERDARGRVSVERYDHCAINEVARTLRYHWSERDELESVEIDLDSDGSVDATLRLRHAC